MANKDKKESILEKVQLDEEELDDFDDLDDDLTELDNTLTVPAEQIADAKEMEKRMTGKDRLELTAEQKRAALRRSIAEKRTMRGARGRSIKQSRQSLNQQVSSMMANPEVETLMQTAMEGDNLEKILQSTGIGTGLNANQLRQALKSASRRK